MSDSPTIVCPSCRSEIRLNESLAAPLIESARRELEDRAQARERAVEEREARLTEKLRDLESQRASLDEQVSERLGKERATLAATEAKKARAALADEIARAQAELAERDALLRERDEKLAEARSTQLELFKKQRELEDQRQELELSVQRRLQEESEKLRQDARRAADEDHRQKLAEKDKLVSDMQRQIEELRRKAEQGSQQLQGEVVELALEATLRTRFPHDEIEPVPKGEHGGDIVQRVRVATGQDAGAILWEAKRAKNWVKDWLPKLRADQRAAKADLAILVSDVLPKEIDGLGELDGVWVVSPRHAVPLVLALRQGLVDVWGARKAGEGIETKMTQVYQYLTGPRFSQRVHALVESFKTMREDLDKERRVLTKHWAKREAQLERALLASAGMYGDLQGIAGQGLAEIEGLDLKALEAGTDSDSDSDSDSETGNRQQATGDRQ
jgi:hypothetical protein